MRRISVYAVGVRPIDVGFDARRSRAVGRAVRSRRPTSTAATATSSTTSSATRRSAAPAGTLPPRRRGAAGRRLACDARPLVGHPLDDGPAHAARRIDPDPGGGRPPALPPVGAVRDDRDHSGFFHTHEAEHGETARLRGAPHRHRGTIGSPWPAGTRSSTSRAPGTCRRELHAHATSTGEWHELTITPSGTPADVQGFGYYGGWHDGGSAGVWRGVGPVVEHDRYPIRPTYRCRAHRTSG